MGPRAAGRWWVVAVGGWLGAGGWVGATVEQAEILVARIGLRHVGRGAAAGVGVGVDEAHVGLLLAGGGARGELEVADAELGARRYLRRVDRQRGMLNRRRLRGLGAARLC